LNISADTAVAVVLGFVGYLIFFNLVTAAIGAAFGIRIQRIQFGFPPSISLLRIGQTDIRLSPLLLGGHVKFADKGDDKPYAPWPVRALVAIAGPITAIAVCAIPLGAQALDEAWMGWPQMLAVTIDFSRPVNIDAALLPSLQAGGLIAASAVVAVKCAMFNLLPSFVLNGGAFLLALAEGATGRDIHSRLPQFVLLLSIALPLAFALILLWRIVAGV